MPKDGLVRCMFGNQTAGSIEWCSIDPALKITFELSNCQTYNALGHLWAFKCTSKSTEIVITD